MSNIAIATDSNSGMSLQTAKSLGISVVPMPFMINDNEYFENVNLTQEEFYKLLAENANICTSQPTPDTLCNLWDELLKDHDEVVYIPMSSGLSGSCQSATVLAGEYDGRVQVVDNKRISVTLEQSCYDALNLAKSGKSALEIKNILEEDGANSSIYIMLDTLYYLKKGGRITPAAAAIGNLLKIKPVLQIQGDKLDAFAKARTVSQGKNIMINAIKADIEKRFGNNPDDIFYMMAYTYDEEASNQFMEEAK
ncbi:MAG: DegV family protein, partial [Lachnospiraceae bacterium]|nr:DegV family protein [Lachnospiraceae bacterium]